MSKLPPFVVTLLLVGTRLSAQEYVETPAEFTGPASIGSNEPMFLYDDQERWKHGWIRIMPYYEGYHSFRPYNYHHVFSQSQTAAGWGMSPVMPYSQQFWHRYQYQLNTGGHTYSSGGPAERGQVPLQSTEGAGPWNQYPAPPVPPQFVSPAQYGRPALPYGGNVPAPHDAFGSSRSAGVYVIDGPALP